MRKPTDYGTLKLLIGEDFVDSESSETRDVFDPAAGSPIGRMPLSTGHEVSAAMDAAAATFESWKDVPITERAPCLFAMKGVIQSNFEDLAYLNTLNHGKTLDESRGDLKRDVGERRCNYLCRIHIIEGAKP